MGKRRLSEGAVSYSAIFSNGQETVEGRMPRGKIPEVVYRFLLGIVRFGRTIPILILLFLCVEVMTDFRAEAQFGSGRSRKSIFSSGRSSRDQGRQPSQSNHSSSQPANSQSQAQPDEPEAPPAPPVQVQPADGVVPVQGAPPQLKAPGTKKGPPGKTAAKQGQKEEKGPQPGIPPEGHVTLFVVPLDQKADVGQEFPLHVWIDNPKSKPIEVVSFVLSYDPRRLEYIDAPGGSGDWANVYDQSEKILTALPLVRNAGVDPFYLNRVDPVNGMIYYRARCAVGESTTAQGFIATMKFRAITPTDQTGLHFIFSDWPEDLAPPVQSDQDWTWPKGMTFVGGKKGKGKSGSGEWVNLLGGDASDRDGVVSGNLTLKGDYTKALKEEEEQIPKGEAYTHISLEPRLNVVQVGKTFDIQLKITNPKGVPWDRIRLELQYDPTYLEVVDSDSGNWITRGTNILDGPFHDRFPFEWIRNNMIRKQDGRIFYEAGIFTSPLRVAGTLATIHLQALRPVPETWLGFHMPSEVGSRVGTVLTVKRQDVLGNTDDPKDGVSGAVVSVVPRKPGDSKEEHAQSKPNKQ
jgi:hypothetical protein